MKYNVNLFWNKVDKTSHSGCWIWIGGTDGKYGCFHTSQPRRNYRAHVISFIIKNGFVPQGKVIHHICNNRLCVNPGHLAAISQSDNIYQAHLDGRVSTRRSVIPTDNIEQYKLRFDIPCISVGITHKIFRQLINLTWSQGTIYWDGSVISPDMKIVSCIIHRTGIIPIMCKK